MTSSGYWLLATGFPIDIVESESLKPQLGEALLEPRDPEPSTKLVLTVSARDFSISSFILLEIHSSFLSHDKEDLLQQIFNLRLVVLDLSKSQWRGTHPEWAYSVAVSWDACSLSPPTA